MKRFLSPAAALALAFPILLPSCAVQAPIEEPQEVPELVWPGPPEPARIRYLGSLRSLEDVAEPRQRSLRDILLGKEQQERPTLVKPYGVHSDSRGRVFVADTGISGLVVFDLEAGSVSFWGASGLGALTKPVGVTSDARGNVYVSDVTDQRVVVFDRDGNYRKAFGGGEMLPSPAGLAFNDTTQRLYVVDSRRHQVVVLDPDGKVDFSIGQRGAEPGSFNYPTNIAIGADGRVYIADTMNFRVQIFEPHGEFVGSFGEVGRQLGNFNRLKGVGVDGDGHIYAVDASYNNFQIFDQEGRLLLFVGRAGTGPGGFYLPAGVHVDRKNRIFVADQYNHRIQMFEYLGNPLVEGTGN